jgi:iron complex transport system ATP-binding protein
MTSLLDFHGVSFAYEGRTIFSGVNFTLPRGECAALIGPNGIGKTTLLRLAAGLFPCSAGRVLLGQRDVNTLRRMEAARLVAMVSQRVEVPFEFTVEQIIEQGRTPYLGLFGGFRPSDHQAIERAIDMTDVGYLRHRIFNQLSGGERQRVKIALGLAQEPDLLLLDEPTQNLDIGRQLELLDLIGNLNANGVTILAAMHDLPLIEGNFSSVLLLSPNQPLLQGSPSSVLKPKILERAFNCPPRQQPVLMKSDLLKDAAL